MSVVILLPGFFLGVTILGVVLCRQEGDCVGDVECTIGRDLCDGFVEGGLDARDVQHQVSLANLCDLLRPQFKIVRLASRWGQVDHLNPLSPDLLGGVGQGIEASHNAQGSPVRSGGG